MFKTMFRYALLIGFFIATSGVKAGPIISEFLASNQSSLKDEDGESGDWIEIHNPENLEADLTGYSLSDDPETPKKWTFPAGTSLPAFGRIIVFSSGKNRLDPNRLHTNFSIATSGGSLQLSNAAGQIVSEFMDYPKQRSDISYGIERNGIKGFFDPPSPREINGTALTGFVADTVFTKKRGFYEGFFVTGISTQTDDASIRYTLNGTKPTPETGIIYDGPFLIASSTIVRAMAYKEGMVPTNVDAQSYFFTGDIINQSEMNPEIANSLTYRDELREALKGLPVVSLSFEQDTVLGRRGIYENPDDKGRGSEREIHFEYFNPANPDDSVHEPAGLRIHGGNSRQHPKKPLRIYFRDDYGDSRLEHEVFPNSPVKSFKSLLLRGGGHDAWTFDSRWREASFVRNQFLHKLQREMGQPSPYGRHVNVFLNGQYWGLYELQEFPHEHYNADHHGGDPEDWDVVKHGQEVEAGSRTAWDALIDLAESGINSSNDYAAIQEYLDLENFADAMIQRIWASDEDWLSPFFLNGRDISTFSDDKNWYVGRKNRNGTTKFFFYNWDAEMSMGIPFSDLQTFENDFSRIKNARSPGIIYDALRRYPEFQLFFADRLRKHCFFGGALTLGPLRKNWSHYTDAVRSPVVAESARWGVQAWLEQDRFSPFTRDDEWLPAVNWVRDQFLPNRTAEILDQFRQVSLYPDTEAPLVLPFGANSATPIEVSMNAGTNNSTIYYTTDGSDPRLAGFTSTTNLIGKNSNVRVIIPDALIDNEIGFTWRSVNPPSNLTSWISGTNGVGYERSSRGNYLPFISTAVDEMWDTNPSLYLRYQFEVPDLKTLESLSSLLLQMRYDDGFAAYLNGTLVSWSNYGTSAWNSTASSPTSDDEAVIFENFDLTPQVSQLQVGTNVLAIHGQNTSPRSSDFLIEAALTSSNSTPSQISPSALSYSGPIKLNTSRIIKARTLTESGQWSALTESYFSIANPASAENLLVTEIHYHPADASTAGELAVSTNKDDYEFLELLNTSGNEIDLSNYRFTRGLAFTFPQGSTIAPSARRIIVSNRQAFLARYGTENEAIILGEFDRDSNLSNGGETLEMRDTENNVVFSFQYNDKDPWPTMPDGNGPSLYLVSATIPSSQLGEAGRWQASNTPNGTPGFETKLSYTQWAKQTYGSPTTPGSSPGDIANGTSDSNLVLYAQGADLTKTVVRQASFTTVNDELLATFTYQVRSNLSDVTITTEASDDLINWRNDTSVVTSNPQANGVTYITVRAATPTLSGGKYFRLSVEINP
ncbi:lamin tail domain-containing protein [Akkermansiaceae bacterium]|nr:lamin tail domain-containing protein [Akkermansiaceae bacterium]